MTLSDASYQEWKAWIWHKPACRVVSIAEHDRDKCTCGLAAKLKAIGTEDPRQRGLLRDEFIEAVGLED